MKSLTLSVPSVRKSIIKFLQIISLKFHITTLELRNNWSSRGFYSKFTAYRLKFLEDFYWPVYFELPLSNNTVIRHALGNDKVEKV